jgi:hypothetical protein
MDKVRLEKTTDERRLTQKRHSFATNQLHEKFVGAVRELPLLCSWYMYHYTDNMVDASEEP